MPNWNPWSGCNIDEGPLASANMDQISEDLNANWGERHKTDQDLLARSVYQLFVYKNLFTFSRIFLNFQYERSIQVAHL